MQAIYKPIGQAGSVGEDSGPLGAIEDRQSNLAHPEFEDTLAANAMKALVCTPLAPPKVTADDVGKLEESTAVPNSHFDVWDVLGLADITATAVGAVADKVARAAVVRTAEAAGGYAVATTAGVVIAPVATVVAGLTAAVLAFKAGADIREHLDASSKARDEAATITEADITSTAMDLVRQKLPVVHGLNDHGKTLAADTFNKWKETTGEKLDSILKQMQQLNEEAGDKSKLAVPKNEDGGGYEKLEATLHSCVLLCCPHGLDNLRKPASDSNR